MATPILQVITQYCAPFVDDIRLSSKNDENSPNYNPPLYAREMWQYFLPAIPMFSLPPEMTDYLLGTIANPNLIAPQYAATQYENETEHTRTFTLTLGAEYKGYDIASVRMKETDAAGYTYYTPLFVNYFSDTGDIQIVLEDGDVVPAGAVLDIDFYKDGYFVNTITPRMGLVLGECFRCVWQNRFATDWLSLVPKIDDKSFTEQNRASKENADTERSKYIDIRCAEEIRKYEQDAYYKKYVHQVLPLI